MSINIRSNADCLRNTGKSVNSNLTKKNFVGLEAKSTESGTKNLENPKNSEKHGNVKNQKSSLKKLSVVNLRMGLEGNANYSRNTSDYAKWSSEEKKNASGKENYSEKANKTEINMIWDNFIYLVEMPNFDLFFFLYF